MRPEVRAAPSRWRTSRSGRASPERWCRSSSATPPAPATQTRAPGAAGRGRARLPARPTGPPPRAAAAAARSASSSGCTASSTDELVEDLYRSAAESTGYDLALGATAPTRDERSGRAGAAGLPLRGAGAARAHAVARPSSSRLARQRCRSWSWRARCARGRSTSSAPTTSPAPGWPSSTWSASATPPSPTSTAGGRPARPSGGGATGRRCVDGASPQGVDPVPGGLDEASRRARAADLLGPDVDARSRPSTTTAPRVCCSRCAVAGCGCPRTCPSSGTTTARWPA